MEGYEVQDGVVADRGERPGAGGPAEDRCASHEGKKDAQREGAVDATEQPHRLAGETGASAPAAAGEKAADDIGDQVGCGDEHGRENGPPGGPHEREVRGRAEREGVEPGDASGAWPSAEGEREKEDAEARHGGPEEAGRKARGSRCCRVVRGGHVFVRSLPAGISLDVSDPPGGPETGPEKGEPFVPHQAAVVRGRSRPDPTAWSGRVAAPKRAHAGNGVRGRRSVARAIWELSSGEDNWKRKRSKTGKGGCFPFPVLERILVRPEVTRELGAPGHAHGATSSRRSEYQRRHRHPPDRLVCGAR